MSQVTGSVSSSLMYTTLTPTTVTAHNLEVKTLSCMDYISQDIEENMDPDKNLCCYYTADQFSKADNTFSIINSRNLYANFNSIIDCLNQFKHLFHIIAISDTLINHEKKADFKRGGVC